MKLKRFFAALLCLALVASLSAVAFAATTTKTYFEDIPRDGYLCTGVGSFFSSSASAKFTTEDDPNMSYAALDPDCYVQMNVFTADGQLLGTSIDDGTTKVNVSLNVRDIVGQIFCYFEFCGECLGSGWTPENNDN